MIEITIPMAPFPQPRMRVTKNGGVYLPREAKEARLEFQAHLLKLTVGQRPLEGEIAVIMGFFRPPKGAGTQGRSKRHLADGDNYEKFVLDACNGILWVDDRQVVDCHWWFAEDELGRVELTVGDPQT